VVIAVVVGATGLLACGDKFSLIGRAARFQQAYAAIHPASILIVMPPRGIRPAAVRDTRLVDALKMAGHRVNTAQQPARLTEVLGRTHYDIVLAEEADAATLDVDALTASAKPAVVAVLEAASADRLAAARPQFDAVLNTPQPLSRILNLIDDVMKVRMDALGRPAVKSR
jgi:hypothetical protein